MRLDSVRAYITQLDASLNRAEQKFAVSAITLDAEPALRDVLDALAATRSALEGLMEAVEKMGLEQGRFRY